MSPRFHLQQKTVNPFFRINGLKILIITILIPISLLILNPVPYLYLAGGMLCGLLNTFFGSYFAFTFRSLG